MDFLCVENSDSCVLHNTVMIFIGVLMDFLLSIYNQKTFDKDFMCKLENKDARGQEHCTGNVEKKRLLFDFYRQ